MIDRDDNIQCVERVFEKLVVEEESIREIKDQFEELEEQYCDKEDQSKEIKELKIFSFDIEIQNILCDKHK